MKKIILLAINLILLSPAYAAVNGTLQGTIVSGTFSNAAGERQYRFYLPKNYNPNSPQSLPLLVFLHGCGQAPEDFLKGTEIAPVADRESFFILLPMQERAYNPLACWNWYLPEHQARGAGEPAIIAGMVNEIKSKYRVDSQKTYLAGFSSGAAMASTLAACYTDVFAATAIHSGMPYQSATTLSEAFQAMNSGGSRDPIQTAELAYRCSGQRSLLMPTIIFQGTSDTTVNPTNAQQLFDQFTQFNDLADNQRDDDSINTSQAIVENGQIPSGHSFRYDHVDYRGKPLIARYTVRPMQHAWSGGSGFQYMDPAGPEASELLWTFFKNYRR
jgi:poly(hydroxyalkanoate) depolymerase family esterase